MNWFTSDWHIGHKNVIGFCDRPFPTLTEMHEALVSNWNERVKPNDIGYFLGDMSFSGVGLTEKYIRQLNGFKVLVRGNHDTGSAGRFINMGFDLVVPNYCIVIVKEEAMYASHYPFNCTRYPERCPEDKGQWILHGHTHSKQKRNGRQLHVGVDAWGFKPCSEEDLDKLRRSPEELT